MDWLGIKEFRFIHDYTVISKSQSIFMEERCLVIVKPEIAIFENIRYRLMNDINEILGCHMPIIQIFRRPTLDDAKLHYQEHAGKPYFDKLTKQLSSGEIVVWVYSAVGAISKLRAALGASMVEDCNSSSLRGRYGIMRGINGIHVSASVEETKREEELWVKYDDDFVPKLNKDFDDIDELRELLQEPTNDEKIRNLFSDDFLDVVKISRSEMTQ